MVAFIAGDTPLASFDYDRPEDVGTNLNYTVQVAGQSIPADGADGGLFGSWDTLLLPQAGFYPVYLRTTNEDGRSERALLDWLVVADPEDEWHNVITARLEWDGAPDSDSVLHRLLSTSREQVEEYAPALPVGAPVPERYRAGQLMQARNTFNASVTNGDNAVDLGGGVLISPRPLDWAVKQLLRPARAKKAVG